MEINCLLTDYIKVLDDTIPEDILENLIKICKESQNFKEASIFRDPRKDLGIVDTKVRKTSTWSIKNIGVKSLTEVHWANLLHYVFSKGIKEYVKQTKTETGFMVNDIQILKYNVGSFYKFHVDSGPSVSRTFSSIFLLNDDYEGGELVFKFPSAENEYRINTKKNRLIIWPSNFLYPHSVLPVIKGTRYSVVSWAL